MHLTRKIGLTCDLCLLPLKRRMPGSHVMERLANATFWSFVATVISRASALVASIIIARLLGRSTFGELGIIQSTLDMFGTVAGFGLGLTSAKYVAQCRTTDPVKAGRIIAISSLTAWIFGTLALLVLVILSPWLAEKVISAPHLTTLLEISGLSLLLGSINGAQMGALTGFEAFRRIARVALIIGLLTLTLRVAGTLLFGLQGAVLGMIIAQAAACIVTYAALRIETAKMNLPLHYRNCLQELPVLWKFSLPATLSSFTVMPALWICNTMLVNQPGGYAEMGIFTAANQWYAMVLFFPGLISQAAMPILCDRLNSGDFNQGNRILGVLLKASSLILIPVVFACVFSKIIMGFYGPAFLGGWLTLLVSVLTAGIEGIQIPVAYMLAAKGRMWVWFFMSLGMACIFVGLNTVLVQHGSVGMACARLTAAAIHCAWSFAFLFHNVRRT